MFIFTHLLHKTQTPVVGLSQHTSQVAFSNSRTLSMRLSVYFLGLYWRRQKSAIAVSCLGSAIIGSSFATLPPQKACQMMNNTIVCYSFYNNHVAAWVHEGRGQDRGRLSSEKVGNRNGEKRKAMVEINRKQQHKNFDRPQSTAKTFSCQDSNLGCLIQSQE